jgi:DNA invertase Pin-like site-specific DNA recombinase
LGDSLRRQLDGTTAYCTANNLELVETIRDEGFSGYHATHRRRGALGRFVKRFEAGEIKPGGVFIAEAFDRVTREPVRKAAQLFLTLINGGMDVHMLIIGVTFTAASIDRNVGELYMAIGMMVGAHGESHTKSNREREAWIARRNGGLGRNGVPSNLFPGWIIKTPKGPQLDRAKAKTGHRIRRLVATMACGQIAKLLNDEGVPLFNDRKRSREQPVWTNDMIQKFIRGRQTLGEQAIGRYKMSPTPTPAT